MGFIDNLRMNGIFGNNGQSPGNFDNGVNMNGGSGMDPMSVLNAIYSMRKRQMDDGMNRALYMDSIHDRNDRQNKLHDQVQKQWGPQPSLNEKPPIFFDEEKKNDKKMTDYQAALIQNDKDKNAITTQNNKTKDENADADRTMKTNNNAQNIAIRQKRAETYDFATKHRNFQILQPKGGNFQLLDPVTKELHDSGIPIGTMTQEDFQNQIQSGRETITGMNNESAANVQNMRNSGNLAAIAARTAGQEEIQSNKPKPAPNSTQQRAGNWNTAQQVINTRPDLGKFITVGTNGQFSIQPPSEPSFWGYGSSSGPTKDQYDELNKLIYGNSNTPAPTKPADTPIITTPGQASRYKMSIGDK